MSFTASMTPGRIEPFKVNRAAPDSRLIRRPRKILRRLSLATNQTLTEDAEPLVVREDFHKEFGRGRGFSYVFSGNEEEKVWTKSKPLKGVKIEVDEEEEANKLKKERKFGKETLTKTWTRSTRPLSERVKDPTNKKQQRDQFRKFMNLGPKKSNDSAMAAQKALMMNENAVMVAEERRKLLELDRVSRKRIKQLEDEVNVLETSFESLRRENEQLRTKLNSGDQIVVESYQRIFEDRNILRKSETSYKARIASVDSQLKELQKVYDKQQKELTELKGKYPSITQRLESQANASKSYWDGKAFKDENIRLRKFNEQLTKENEELKKRLRDHSNLYSPSSPRGRKFVSEKLPEVSIAKRFCNENVTTPKNTSYTYNKTKEAGTIKKYDPLYTMREDFVNMLPDYFPDRKSYKTASY